MEMVMVTMMMMIMMMAAETTAETAAAAVKMAPIASPWTPSTAREVDCQI